MKSKTLKERIVAMLHARNMSSRALEMKLGLGNGVIYRMDTVMPSAETLQRIADYLGTTIPYLLYGREGENYYDNDETAHIAQEIFDNKQLRSLFDVAKDASPEDLLLVQTILMRIRNGKRTS